MANFKNKEEYENWKIEKQKELQQTKPAVQVSKKSSMKRLFTFLAIGLLILVPAVIFSWHYMTHGSLSGDVYVTMKSGDVKRAAGIEVMLIAVPSPQQILKEIEKSKADSNHAIITELRSTSSLQNDVDRDVPPSIVPA